MATEVIHSIRDSGGDYTSLTDWQTAQVRDLVAADEIAVAEIYSDYSGEGLSVSGSWVTDSTRRVVVRAASGQEHTGVFGSGAGIRPVGDEFQASSNGIFCSSAITFSILNLELDSLTRSGVSLSNWGPDSLIDRCISRGPTYGIAPGRSTPGHNIVIRNSVCVGGVRAISGHASASFPGHVLIENCVAISSNDGIYSICGVSANRSFTVVNTVAIGGVRDWYVPNATIFALGSNNASGDYTNYPPTGSDKYTSDVVSADFVDDSSDDYRLASGSGLIAQGVNKYADYTKDCAGNDWPVSDPFDIGAFRFIAGGALPTLSASTYKPGTLTATGWTPRITAT